MKRLLLPVALAATFGFAVAKLPPPDEAAKAQAAEKAAKAAWQAKVSAWQLCKAQDRVAARYKSNAGKQGNPPTAGTAMPVVKADATQAGASAPAAVPPAQGTPVAAAPPPPCIEPGPFAYNPPAQKPLETSGAHSPSGTAATPPSVKAETGQLPPAAPKKP